MEEIERIHERLENVKAIEPILSALRTIAGASWRAALKRRKGLEEYASQLKEVLTLIVPCLPPSDRPEDEGVKHDGNEALLVISAERGLCGSFNRTILEAAEGFIYQERAQGRSLHLLTLGEKAKRRFDSLEIPILRAESLPVTSLFPFANAESLAHWILDTYERGEISGLQIIFNQYISAVTCVPTVRRLLPFLQTVQVPEEQVWPPPIIENDPAALYELISKQLVSVQLYAAVIESAASEQAARLQAMERSSQNAERLIEELSLSYHQARQQAITQEMLDLVAGAGMLAGATEEGNRYG